MDIDRRTLAGILLILFLFASWGLGNVMHLSPRLGGGSQGAELNIPVILWPLSLLILAGALYMAGRRPVYFLVPAVLAAALFSPYLLIYRSFWFILIVVMIALLALLYLKGYRDRRITAFVVILALFALLFFGITFFDTGGLMPTEYGGDGEAPSLPWDDPGRYMETTFGGLGNLIFIILVTGVLLFVVSQKFKPLLDAYRAEEKEDEEIEKDLSSTVKKALSDLYKGKEVEPTVLRCYQRMCNILEARGVKDTDFTTPREFERRAIDELDVPASNLEDIREVFELAKYSTHQLGEEDRDRAVKALKDLRKELE